MKNEKAWKKFLFSGKVEDYLNFVNSHREKELSEGIGNAFYDRSIGYKGNEDRRE